MIEQVGIAFTGLVAIGLSQTRSETTRKWASVFGLAGQPFWFYAAFSAEQWGIFVMSFAYSAMWTMGFYNNWVKVK